MEYFKMVALRAYGQAKVLDEKELKMVLKIIGQWSSCQTQYCYCYSQSLFGVTA